MALPIVSVLITVFNRRPYLAAAIESVLAQSLPDFELIIVDDGSTDSSVEIARRYVSDPRVRIHQNDHNLGDYPNRNRAAALARGRYLKYVDADDLIYPHCLEVMVQGLEAFPEAALGISRALPGVFAPAVIAPAEAYRDHFFGSGLFSVGPLDTIIRRSAFEELGGFDPARHTSDLLCWLRLAQRHPVVVLAPGLVWWRTHGQQESMAETRTPRIVAEVAARRMQIVLDRVADATAPFTESERKLVQASQRQAYARRIVHALRNGQFDLAGVLYRRAGQPATALLKALARHMAPSQPRRAPAGGARRAAPVAALALPPASAAPRVSVLLPACNAEAHLAGAIESVCAQRFRHWELIIVDDASTDRTGEVVRAYTADARIRYFRNARHLGAWPNHNRCAELARGKYLKFLHPADRCYPHALQIMVAMMEHYAEAGLGVACEVGPYRVAACLTPQQVLCAEFFATPMLDCSLSATIIRRDVFRAVGALETDFPPCDRRLQLRLANHRPVVRLCSGLIVCERHQGPNRSLCGTWPLGWAQGCEWLVPWLRAEATGLPEADRHQAAANVLRYLRDGGDRVRGCLPPENTRKHRALARQVAQAAGIAWSTLAEPAPDGVGWTAARREAEGVMAGTEPPLAAFLGRPL